MMAVLHALLFLLKCIGIVFLALLGLLIFVLLLALFAPVRYRGHLEKKEEPEEVFSADGLISWLNPLVRIRLLFREKKFCYTVRLFGFCLINSEKPKKEKSSKKQVKTKKSRKKDKKRRDEKTIKEQPDTAEQRGENGENASEELPAEPSGSLSAEIQQEAVAEQSEATARVYDEQQEGTDGTKKGSFFTKIKDFIRKIKEGPGKVKEKVSRLIKQGKLLWHKKEKVGLFLQDELHVLAIGKAWATVKKLFQHVLPGKIKGRVYFGTGDPESTGKALGVLGMLYAAYGKGLEVIPDFYEKHLIAELKLKGRIRFGTMLRHVLKLIRDKQVKRFYKNWKKLLKVLKQKVD